MLTIQKKESFGKNTSANNLAVALPPMEHRVLLEDINPQARSRRGCFCGRLLTKKLTCYYSALAFKYSHYK